MNRIDYEENPKRCLYCGKPIVYEKRKCKFCNQSCSAKFNNKGVRRHGEEPGNCLYCGKKLKEHVRRFCCHNHQLLYQYESYIKDWLSGNVNGNKSCNEQVSNHIRKYLRDKNNNSCEKCGWNTKHPLTGEVPLTVHHKDGNSENTTPENVELICPNCHSLTENYGGRNMGNGRKSRRIYMGQ